MNTAKILLLSITIILSVNSCDKYDRKQMDRLYAQGREEMSLKSYSNAIVTLTQAENYARKIKNYKQVGDICYDKAEINFFQGNCPEAEDQIEKAIKYYRFSDTTQLHKIGFLAAEISQGKKEHQRSKLLYESSLSYYRQKKDTAKIVKCLIGLSELQLDTQDGEKAVELMNEARQKYGYRLSAKETAEYAYAKALNGSMKAAEELFDGLPKDKHFEYDQYLSDYLCLKGQQKEAISIIKRLDEHKDSTYNAMLRTSTVKTLEVFYYYNAELERIKRLKDIWIWAISVFTLAFTVILVTMISAKKRRRQVEEFEEILEETNRKLTEGRSDANELRSQIARYYRPYFQMIANLYEKYLLGYSEKEGAKFARKELLPLFQSLRRGAGTGSEFESLLNANMNGVMTKLRNTCPDLKENDFVFLSYLIAGFDTSLISKIMDMTKDGVRTRKSRLLKKLKDSSLDEDVLHLLRYNC